MANKPQHPMEIVGINKARREIAGRLAEAIGEVLGSMGVCLSLSVQDGTGDNKTGEVPFSTWTYTAWTSLFHQQPDSVQAQIAMLHLEQSLKALEDQRVKLKEQIAQLKAAAEAKEAEGAPPVAEA